MNLEPVDQVVQRLERLEAQNRTMRKALAALIPVAGLACVLALLGQGTFSCTAGGNTPASTDVVRAKRVEVVNEKGVPVVVLSTDQRGWGKIVSFREDQQQLVQIAATDEGGTVAVAGAKGQLRAALGVAKQDYGSVFTFDGKSQRLVSLGTAAFGDGAVFSYDRAGNVKKMWP